MMNPADNPRNIGNAYGGESNMLDALASLADQAPASVQPGIPASAAPPVEEYVGAQQGMPGAQQRQIRAEVQQAAANPVERPTAPPPEVVIPYPDPLKYDMTNPRDIDRYNKDYVAVAIQRGDLTVPTPQATGAVNTQEVVNAGAQPGQAVQPVQNGGPSVSNAQPQGGASPVVRPLVGIRGSGRRDQGDMGTSTGSPVNPGGQPSGGGVPAARPAPAVGGGTPAAPQRPAAAGGAGATLPLSMSDIKASMPAPPTPVSPARKQRQADAQLNKEMRASGQLPADGSQMAHYTDANDNPVEQRNAVTALKGLDLFNQLVGAAGGFTGAVPQAPRQQAPQQQATGQAGPSPTQPTGNRPATAQAPAAKAKYQYPAAGPVGPLKVGLPPGEGQPGVEIIRPGKTSAVPALGPAKKPQENPVTVVEGGAPGRAMPGKTTASGSAVTTPGNAGSLPAVSKTRGDRGSRVARNVNRGTSESSGSSPRPAQPARTAGALPAASKPKPNRTTEVQGSAPGRAMPGRTTASGRAIEAAGVNSPAKRQAKIQRENESLPKSAGDVKASLDQQKQNRAVTRNNQQTMDKATAQEIAARKSGFPTQKPIEIRGSQVPRIKITKDNYTGADTPKPVPKKTNEFNVVRNSAGKPADAPIKEVEVTSKKRSMVPRGAKATIVPGTGRGRANTTASAITSQKRGASVGPVNTRPGAEATRPLREGPKPSASSPAAERSNRFEKEFPVQKQTRSLVQMTPKGMKSGPVKVEVAPAPDIKEAAKRTGKKRR